MAHHSPGLRSSFLASPIIHAWPGSFCNSQHHHHPCHHVLQLLIQDVPFQPMWPREWMAATPSFKFPPGASGMATFPTPPTMSYTLPVISVVTFSWLPLPVPAGVSSWHRANQLQALVQVRQASTSQVKVIPIFLALEQHAQLFNTTVKIANLP